MTFVGRYTKFENWVPDNYGDFPDEWLSVSFGARALIRLGALNTQLRHHSLCENPDAKIMAVIKANAYGHGMIRCCEEPSRCRCIRGCAQYRRRFDLRRYAGVDNKIVLLAGVTQRGRNSTLAIQYWEFQQVVHCDEQIQLLERLQAGSIICWLKLDTGMNRLGFPPSRARELCERLRCMPAVRDVRLMTHLSSADEVENETTSLQLQRFMASVDTTVTDVSISNSAGALGWPEIQAQVTGGNFNNWIRPGIVLFGISPFEDRGGADLGLKPVMQFEARLIAVKPLAKGDCVGYKRTYRSTSDTTLGLISAGYGDGYSRHFRSGTPVLINGRKVPLIGNVSMDMIAVDLGWDAKDRVGDIATLWGKGLPVEEVAPWADAIPYDLVCGVMNREASEIVD